MSTFVGQSVGRSVGLSKKVQKKQKWGIQPMSANMNCFNGLELSGVVTQCPVDRVPRDRAPRD